MLYFQMPMYFFIGAMFYLYPRVGFALLGSYLAFALWINSRS